jgi:hypothetical protein
VGTGYNGIAAGVMKKDFWEYHPDSTTSLNEISATEVQIIMNSSNASLTVNFENISGIPVNLQLLEASGKLVTEYKNAQFPLVISTAGFSDGVYFLTASNIKNSIWSKKFLVKNL